MSKGYKEYLKFKNGSPLTRREAILAQCFQCNGPGEGGEDCKGHDCPLYQYMPHRAGSAKRANKMTEEQRRLVGERLRRGKEAKKASEAA